MQTHLKRFATFLLALAACTTLAAQERFHATGPSSPVKMEPHQQSVVQVNFDLLPTTMRFNAPAYPCMVTENDIQDCNGFAETYDPRLDRNARETSFEPGFDDFNEYTVPLGHMINYGHYRKTENSIEQVYLSGMIESKDPGKELVPLAWSWIVPPKVSTETMGPGYETEHYDPIQKAYILDWKHDQEELDFELIADPDYYGVATTIVNPAFVVSNWGKDPVEVEIDEKAIKPGKDFRIGYEATVSGTNLILWLRLQSKEPVNISLRKGGE